MAGRARRNRTELRTKLENVPGYTALQLVTDSDDRLTCAFCKKHQLNNYLWGHLYKYEEIVVHYFCLMFSRDLRTKGVEGQGILCNLPQDIRTELNNGKEKICMFCGKGHGTIVCSHNGCQAAYHYPCGLEAGYRFNFGSFTSNCTIKGHYKEWKGIPTSLCSKCSLCLEDYPFRDRMLDSIDPNYPLWSPCCNKGQSYHRECISRYAYDAGIYFRCPVCPSKRQFKDAMQRMGVYCPYKDAEWELEPNAYNMTMPLTCSAYICHCPIGNDDDERRRVRKPGGTVPCRDPWLMVPCAGCGGTGRHRYCGGLHKSSLKWYCDACSHILAKPKAKSMHLGKVWDDDILRKKFATPLKKLSLEELDTVRRNADADAAMSANEEGKFVCRNCSYPFARINALKKHMKLKRCGNKGGRPTNASIIAAQESLPRPFVCGKCNFAFRRSHHLADHVDGNRCGIKGGRPSKKSIN